MKPTGTSIGALGMGVMGVGILLLAACASMNVSHDYDLNGQSSGLLIVSVSGEGMRPNESPVWNYQRTDGTHGGEIITSYLREPADWQSPQGRLVYIALPPGRYEFYKAGFPRQTSGSTASWSIGKGGVATNTNPNYAGFNAPQYRPQDATRFRVPFEIVAGQATYIGNLHFVWSEWQRQGHVIVRNEALRDLALLRERLPRVRAEQIRMAMQPSSNR